MNNKNEPYQFYRGSLPHFRGPHAVYFVTWRLHKLAVPLEPNERTLIADAINYYNESRYWLHGFVVMDDHVHGVVRIAPQCSVQKTVQNWKSFTSHKLIKQGEREGQLWQQEYFDRIIRDASAIESILEYIKNNPSKRWPDIGHYEWCRVFVETESSGGSTG